MKIIQIVARSSSEKRIKKAKEKFEEVLKEATVNDILNWKKVIDDAVITTFEIVGRDAKMQATQIFAFQNDRGKDLTTLEKLKAFLMHKIYAVSEDENPESEIKDIETVFSEIYKQTERISFTEDAVLRHHCMAYLSGWDAPMDNVKKEIQKTPDNKKKEKWIIEFINNLKETFYTVEEIEKKSEQNCAIADVMILDSHSTLPLLIKLFHYHKQNENLIEELSRKIENVLFKLEFKNADYRTNNFPSIAKHYKGKDVDLRNELSHIQNSGFQWWWQFNANCINYFNGTYHYYSGIKYVLWKYENFLRRQNRTRELSPIEYNNKFNKKRLENTIDHITPQNPDFREYTEEFQNNWLNNMGNLTLMVWGDNSEKRNHNPTTKTDLYDSDFYSYKEIRDVLTDLQKQGQDSFWDKKQIIERKDKILEFVFEDWELK
ncbi:MAG: HNH endonuclease family protein [Dysgonamonadaceae bacterium]|nr:HNH endonuclease family protein [Dysgonamonadaceae bacterium]